jgi:hypothetical protein
MTVVLWAATAAPVLACVPPPPVDWQNMLANQKVSIFLGTVDRVEPLSERPHCTATVSSARAHIGLTQVVKGQPAILTAEVVGVTEIRSADPIIMNCFYYLPFRVGDRVFVVDGPNVGQRQVVSIKEAVGVPQLVPFVESQP